MKIYKIPTTRFVELDSDELLQFQGASTNLDDTGYGGNTSGGGGGIEVDTKQKGMWGWTDNDN